MNLLTQRITVLDRVTSGEITTIEAAKLLGLARKTIQNNLATINQTPAWVLKKYGASYAEGLLDLNVISQKTGMKPAELVKSFRLGGFIRQRPQLASGSRTKRDYRLWCRYRLEIEAIGAKCEICGKEKNLCCDHSHESGAVRGTLCSSCNAALGSLGDSYDKAIKVLSGDIKKYNTSGLTYFNKRGLAFKAVSYLGGVSA